MFFEKNTIRSFQNDSKGLKVFNINEAFAKLHTVIYLYIISSIKDNVI